MVLVGCTSISCRSCPGRLRRSGWRSGAPLLGRAFAKDSKKGARGMGRERGSAKDGGVEVGEAGARGVSNEPRGPRALKIHSLDVGNTR